MNKPLISIIIPFYNEENFISRSLTSCLNQTYPNLEIILVDDYSTDNTVKIIDEITKGHANIKVVKSRTKGIGSARNTGLQLVNGEYFSFLDADDELDVSFIEVCYNNSISSGSEISIVQSKVFDVELNEINTENSSIKKETINGLETLQQLYSFQIIASVWGKLFKRTLISDTQFNEDFIFEDKPFLVEILLKTKQIHLSNEKLYLHFANPNSISRSVIDSTQIKDSASSFIAETKLLSKSSHKDILLPLSFNCQYFIMLDLFFLMNIDEKKIDKKNMTSVFLANLSRVKQQAKLFDIKPTAKKKALLILLRSINILGWKIPFMFLKRYFSKHFTFIQKIKQ